MQQRKKCPVVGTNTGDVKSKPSISPTHATGNIRYPKNAKPKNINEARLLNFLQAETSLTKERRNGFWIDAHSDTLRLIGGGDYAAHMRSLESSGHIEANGNRYSKGRFPRSYRLTRRFRIPATDIWPTRKRFNLKARVRLHDDDDVGRGMVERFSLLELPAMTITGWAEYSVQAISERHFYAVRCPYDRFHTTFTSAAKRVRRRLMTKGTDLVECDIANCQPLLLGILTRDHNQPTTRPPTTPQPTPNPTPQPTTLSICCTKPDLDRYLEICSNGYLYEHLTELATKAGLTLLDFIPRGKRCRWAENRPLERNDLKRSFVVALFADVALMKRLPIWPIVEQEFPTIARFILWAKRHDYRNLAHKCQRLESKIMVRPNGVADEMLQATDAGFFTIHDAIAVPENLAELATEIIKDKFRPFGVAPEVAQ